MTSGSSGLRTPDDGTLYVQTYGDPPVTPVTLATPVTPGDPR